MKFIHADLKQGSGIDLAGDIFEFKLQNYVGQTQTSERSLLQYVRARYRQGFTC